MIFRFFSFLLHSPHYDSFICSDGEFVAYKRKRYSEIRVVRTKFGTKSSKSNLHASTDSVIASTSMSQPYMIVIHMEQESHYKLQTRILVRGGKEVCKMSWHQIIFSIQSYGKFKGKRKVNIGGLVDKTC
jgi:hypothetical protein